MGFERKRQERKEKKGEGREAQKGNRCERLYDIPTGGQAQVPI